VELQVGLLENYFSLWWDFSTCFYCTYLPANILRRLRIR